MNSSPRAAFSIPSIISIVAAIWSFYAQAIGGLLLAVIAIVFGVLGLALSILPNTRGGIISFIGVFAGGIGVIAAIIKAILWIAGR